MALTQQMILEKLHEIPSPDGQGSLVEAGAVRGIEIEGGSVKVVLAVPAPNPNIAGGVREIVQEALSAMDDRSAASEGYPDLNSYREKILSFHPGMTWNESHLVWVHEFRQV